MAEEIEEMIMLVRSKQRRSIQRATSIYTTQGPQAGINAMGQPFNSPGMASGVVALPGVNLAGPNPAIVNGVVYVGSYAFHLPSMS